MATAGEAADVGDVADQSRGAGRADPVELQQVTARCRDQFGQLLVGRLDLLVNDGEFGDQLRGELPAGAPDDVTRSDGVEQGTGLWRGQEFLGAAGEQFQQQAVQAVDQLGAGSAQGVAAVDQQPATPRLTRCRMV